ncbi:ankyrin repeat protein [Seminavis robusta]|uniref:Ankyrin repeat protein n=1 Tax=Seminavis robusta TaxID=568900 RepID=A0A9N8E778_9STRA|nr:ankyrin repeat protein [Seminavis robusta]|eukprot:Sro569_g168340.1 ankyrin repeat protein (299) ;mRNA; r:23167-24218
MIRFLFSLSTSVLFCLMWKISPDPKQPQEKIQTIHVSAPRSRHRDHATSNNSLTWSPNKTRGCKSRNQEPLETMTKTSEAKPFQHLLDQKDLWTFCDTVDNPPKVWKPNQENIWVEGAATASDTFFSAAFVNVSCAKYWELDKDEDAMSPWTAVCQEAASIGSLQVLQWAHNKNLPWNEMTCKEAAKHGHMAVLKWARAKGCPWDEMTCKAAAKHGQLEVLKWARASGCPWDESTCAEAAFWGHLEIVKWVRAGGCPWDELVCHYAAGEGHLDILNGHMNTIAHGKELLASLQLEMVI